MDKLLINVAVCVCVCVCVSVCVCVCVCACVCVCVCVCVCMHVLMLVCMYMHEYKYGLVYSLPSLSRPHNNSALLPKTSQSASCDYLALSPFTLAHQSQEKAGFERCLEISTQGVEGRLNWKGILSLTVILIVVMVVLFVHSDQQAFCHENSEE